MQKWTKTEVGARKKRTEDKNEEKMLNQERKT